MTTTVMTTPRPTWRERFDSLNDDEQQQMAACLLMAFSAVAPRLAAKRQRDCDRTATALLVDVEVENAP